MALDIKFVRFSYLFQLDKKRKLNKSVIVVVKFIAIDKIYSSIYKQAENKNFIHAGVVPRHLIERTV